MPTPYISLYPKSPYLKEVLWYPAQYRTPKATFLYFHGGGLIFGQPNDLPQDYIKQLVQAGYQIIAFDYPLFPRHDFKQILQAAQAGLDWYLREGFSQLKQSKSDYILFGRSAGAYLALYLTAHAATPPLATISLYGYYQLTDASFSVPSRHYLQFPKLSDEALDQLLKKPNLTADDRYLIYLGLRQKGSWLKQLAPDTNLKAFQITADQLAKFPPSFIAAADQDPDVPSRQSRKLAQAIPQSQLTIVASSDHDFDRTQIDTLGQPLYSQLITWLDQVI